MLKSLYLILSFAFVVQLSGITEVCKFFCDQACCITMLTIDEERNDEEGGKEESKEKEKEKDGKEEMLVLGLLAAHDHYTALVLHDAFRGTPAGSVGEIHCPPPEL